jgi:hypothetical protein
MLRAALILVGVGSLVAMERGTPPRAAQAVDQPFTPSTVGAGDSRDTLAQPDRLEIPHFQNEPPAQPLSFADRMPPPGATALIAKEASKSVSGNRHDVSARKVAFASPKPRPRIPDSKPRPKTTDSKTSASKTVANMDRSKAPMDLKPCRPNPFDSLRKALNLRSGCEA